MRIKRRIWVLLLSAAIIMTFLPTAAFADETTVNSQDVPEPEWVIYEGSPTLRGILGTDKFTNLETPDISRFIVTYTDGSEKTFEYKEKEYGDGDTGYRDGAFIDMDDPEQDPLNAKICLYAEVKQNDENPVRFEKGWNDNVELSVIVQYAVPGDGPDQEEVEQKVLSTYVDVLCAPDYYPTKVEFIPAEGFVPECIVGSNYLTEDMFYGEGNAFRVSCYGWTAADPDKGIEEGLENFTRTYEYAKGKDADGEEVEGFYKGGSVRSGVRFDFEDGATCNLKYGEEKKVKFTYMVYVEDYDEYVSVPFKITVKATKYEPSVNYPTFKYTGKVIKPKFKVKNYKGKLIPDTAYDVKYKKASKMGRYEARITFNDNFADKDKYVDSFIATYDIGPAAPTNYKPAAGKKSLTVKWKKLTKAELKNIDGFYIELSTDKQFIGNYKDVKISKTTVKKGKKLVKGLKKGKKYYVRISAYKTIKQDGEKFKMYSSYSKVKYNKTK